MAGDLGLLSLTQLHKLAQQHPNPSSTPGSLMWNTTRRTAPDDDDSWEVRAFAEDTGNTMGTTWPPRSYTCTFCRREFRSAQALGGHMNVHRRDRARLRQSPPVSDPTPSPTSSSPFIFPTQEFVASGGLCLFYPLPNHGAVFTQAPENGCLESPSTHLSISPCTPCTSSKAISSNPHSFSFPGMDTTSICQPSKVQSQVPINNDSNDDDEDDHDHDSKSKNVCNNHNEPIVEELDLELRLGQRPTQH